VVFSAFSLLRVEHPTCSGCDVDAYYCISHSIYFQKLFYLRNNLYPFSLKTSPFLEMNSKSSSEKGTYTLPNDGTLSITPSPSSFQYVYQSFDSLVMVKSTSPISPSYLILSPLRMISPVEYLGSIEIILDCQSIISRNRFFGRNARKFSCQTARPLFHFLLSLGAFFCALGRNVPKCHQKCRPRLL
jgi:hypothetical protein